MVFLSGFCLFRFLEDLYYPLVRIDPDIVAGVYELQGVAVQIRHGRDPTDHNAERRFGRSDIVDHGGGGNAVEPCVVVDDGPGGGAAGIVENQHLACEAFAEAFFYQLFIISQ